MEIKDYEISRKVRFDRLFINNNKKYLLSNYMIMSIVTNDNCNADCKFCSAKCDFKKDKLNLKKAIKKIEFAINDLHVKEIILLGGESTINNDIFKLINYLKSFKQLNKILMTTNGFRMRIDREYAENIFSSGLTHINLSLMTLNIEYQKYYTNTNFYIDIEHLKEFKYIADSNNVDFRINSHCFKGNNDNIQDILRFYNRIKYFCHSIKLTPLLRTEIFKTKQNVTNFNNDHTLGNKEYDDLFQNLVNYFYEYPVIMNNEALGFEKEFMILLKTPIIISYKHNSKIGWLYSNNKIPGIKLLSNGELSFSWNKDEVDQYIKID